MGRKDFFLFFWKKYLRFLLFTAILLLAIFNIENIIEISKGFKILIITVIVVFSIGGVLQFLLNETILIVPQKIRLIVFNIWSYLQKFKFILPVALILFVTFNWENKSFGGNVLLILMITYLIYDSYFKITKIKN